MRLPGAGEPVRARRGGGDLPVGAAKERRPPRRRPGAAARWARASATGSRAATSGLRLARVLIAADGSEAPLAGTLASRLANPAQAARLQVEEVDLRADACSRRAAARRPRRAAADQARRADADPGGRAAASSSTACRSRSPRRRSCRVATLTDAAGPAGAAEVRLTIAADPRVRAALAAGRGAVRGRRARDAAPPRRDRAGRRLAAEPPGAALVRGRRDGRAGDGRAARSGAAHRRSTCAATACRRSCATSRRASCSARSDRQRGLSVLPALVYGSPPVARIDAGKLVYLRGPVPLRDVPAERPGRRAAARRAGSAARPPHQLRRRATRPASSRSSNAGAAISRATRPAIVKPAATLAPRLRVITEGEPGRESVRFELTFAAVERPWRGGRRRGQDADRIGRRGRGRARLAGGARARAARRAAAGRRCRSAGWRSTASASPICWPRARTTAGWRATRCPRSPRLCAELEHPPPPGPRSAGAAGRRASSGSPRRRCRAISRRRCARTSARASTGSPSCAAPAWAACSPTTWASARRCRRCARSSGRDAGRLPDQRAVQLAGGAGALPPGAEGVACTTGRGARPRRDRRRDADHATRSCASTRRRWRRAAWDAVVLDEAQAIKNPDSQTARAAYALPASFRLALTGTPVENRLEELWSLMHFTNRGPARRALGLRGALRAPDRRGRARAPPRRCASASARSCCGASSRTSRPSCRRAPRPSCASSWTTASAPSTTPCARRRARTSSRCSQADGKGGGVIKALEALLRLRQAACHPALVPGQSAPTSSKVEALLEALATAVAEGHKALVFSQWTSLLDLIEPALDARRAAVRAPRRQHARPRRGRRRASRPRTVRR